MPTKARIAADTTPGERPIDHAALRRAVELALAAGPPRDLVIVAKEFSLIGHTPDFSAQFRDR